jgi:hypothetical protein
MFWPSLKDPISYIQVGDRLRLTQGIFSEALLLGECLRQDSKVL